MNKKKLLGTGLCTALATVALVSCGGGDEVVGDPTYTYNDTTAVSPSNWNAFTYQDANDTQIMSHLGSALFTFDYLFDDNGEIVDGGYTVKGEAATDLKDVTEDYATDNKYDIPDDAKKNYAYKITLRDNLEWDDGTKITAHDFVWSMKELLDPAFKNFRADTYYNNAIKINSAKNYFYQGSTGDYPGHIAYSEYKEDLDSKLIFALGEVNGVSCKVRSDIIGMGIPSSATAAQMAGVIKGNFVPDLDVDVVATMEGKTFAEIKADAAMKAEWDKLFNWWHTDPNEELHFFIAKGFVWPEVSFDEVGIKALDDQNLVIMLDSPVELLNEDGSLSYQAAYSLQELPLAHKAKYEANKVAPQEGSKLWTSKYNSSVDTTASWGPYKLVEFQAGKYYELVRNDNWFGYDLEENKGLYQTQKIAVKTVKENETNKLLFLKGELTSLGIDVTIAEQYKNSERAIFTPGDFVQSMQLQSNVEKLEANQKEASSKLKKGVNKTILGNPKFRKAISLGIDRDDYTKKLTTSAKAGFGLFNTMHYYDVSKGLRYRDTDPAKKALLSAYGIEFSEDATTKELDKKLATLTGYNLDAARILMTDAYNEELEAGKIKADDTVILVMGSSGDSKQERRIQTYIQGVFDNITKGTPLEGRVQIDFEDHQQKWADDFRAGAYEICMGGWSGAAWNPAFFLAAYVDKNNMYSQAWDTEHETFEFTYTDQETKKPVTATYTIMDWYNNLNGNEGCKVNMAEGYASDEDRIRLIATIEAIVLTKYYTVPIANQFSASLLSYQVEYISTEYNTFMAYGGLKYMKYNMSDQEWAKFVKDNGGQIDYTK